MVMWFVCLQDVYIVDSSEPYALKLSDEALERTLSCPCVGWHTLICCTANQTLVDSKVRKQRTMLD